MKTSLKALAIAATVAIGALAAPAFAQQPVPDKAATMASPAKKATAKHKAAHHAKHKAKHAAKHAAKKS